MKCASCGKDAVSMVGDGQVIQFALCWDCLQDRLEKVGLFGCFAVDTYDLWDKAEIKLREKARQG